MTTKYMLISTAEREFLTPAFFDTKEESHKQMTSELLEQIGSFENYEKDVDYGVDETGAWANVHINSDWAIYKVTAVNGTVSIK
jgi:hypothetical protein